MPFSIATYSNLSCALGGNHVDAHRRRGSTNELLVGEIRCRRASRSSHRTRASQYLRIRPRFQFDSRSRIRAGGPGYHVWGAERDHSIRIDPIGAAIFIRLRPFSEKTHSRQSLDRCSHHMLSAEDAKPICPTEEAAIVRIIGAEVRDSIEAQFLQLGGESGRFKEAHPRLTAGRCGCNGDRKIRWPSPAQRACGTINVNEISVPRASVATSFRVPRRPLW